MKTNIRAFIIALFIAGILPTSSQATNYINNGTFVAYNLKSGDTLRIAQGTFNGVITALPAGAVIIVAQNATFSPTALNLFAPVGKVINNGTCNFISMGIGAGFSLYNYSNVNVQGDMDFYSGIAKTVENYLGGTITVTGEMSLNNNTTINNSGIINVAEDVNLYSSTAKITNKGIMLVSGSVNNEGILNNDNILRIAEDLNYWGGQLNNTGEITPKGTFSIGGGLTYVNTCRMITKGAINNYGTLRNEGLIWAGTTNTAADNFTNSGSYIGKTGSKIRAATFVNYSNMTGSGYVYATGVTTLGGGATVGVTGVTTDSIFIFDATRTSPSRIFDNQWGTVRPNAVFKNFAQPDSLQLYATCSDIFKTSIILPIKWNYFNVKMIQQQPVLNWSAEYEAGMRFDIERSYDNSNFTVIGSTTADNSGSYSFTDVVADLSNAFVSYRIKGSSAASGLIKYTEIRVIRTKETQTATLSLYPNPTVEKAFISYKSQSNEQVTVQVRSAAGQQLSSTKFSITAGFNRVELGEVKRLKPGMYFVDVMSEGKTVASEKLIKQ
jgi:hypothetical protein